MVKPHASYCVDRPILKARWLRPVFPESYRLLCVTLSKELVAISVRHGDAGDVVASPKLKNWPLYGQKFSTFGQSIQLHSRGSEVVSIFPTKGK